MSEPHVVAKGGGARLDAVRWPVHTERLALRPAEAADAEATWRFRQLDEVTRWLTGRSASLDEHRLTFMDPDRLSKTLVVELDGEVIRSEKHTSELQYLMTISYAAFSFKKKKHKHNIIL